jgi:hypothetical protein
MSDWQLIPTTRRVVALDWDGDDLVSGDYRWAPDGTTNDPRMVRGEIWPPFDQTITFGGYRAVYAERGTKALLMRGGKLIRELNRSYYRAGSSDYPIALGALPDGREVVVHCPEKYNVLEVEDAATGERLTTGPRKPADEFHSRLSISPDGRHLLSAGWVWQPMGFAEVFDLVDALRDPTLLDGAGMTPLMTAVDGEVWSACWLDDDHLAVSAGGSELSGQFGVWSLAAGDWTFLTTVDFPIGVTVPVGDRLLCLYGHPDCSTPPPAPYWPSGRR